MTVDGRLSPAWNVPGAELMDPGVSSCQGCGASLSLRLALKVLGKKSVFLMPACCSAVVDGPWPYSAMRVPLLHTAFAASAAVATGVKAGLEMLGEDEVQVVVWAGDGGTFDIGLQALSGAAERNEDLLYFCYDNEAYMNTGIQRSSATPFAAWTTTTPAGNAKAEPKKNLVEIMAAHGIPYVATASMAFPDDFIAKVERARKLKGMRVLHLLSTCPPGWRVDSAESVEVARLATLSRVFPLYEVFDGKYYRLNLSVDEPVPVREYLQRQGRFAHLGSVEVDAVQARVDEGYRLLLLRLEASR